MGKVKLKINDKIDNEIRKEKYKSYKIVFYIIISLSFLYVPFFPIYSSNIEGITTQLTANLTEDGNIPIWKVRIHDKKIVNASLQTKMVFQKDKKVEIRVTKKLVGTRSYRVLRYL